MSIFLAERLLERHRNFQRINLPRDAAAVVVSAGDEIEIVTDQAAVVGLRQARKNRNQGLVFRPAEIKLGIFFAKETVNLAREIFDAAGLEFQIV